MKQYIIDINDTPLDFSTNNNMTNEELEAAIEKLDAEILVFLFIALSFSFSSKDANTY